LGFRSPTPKFSPKFFRSWTPRKQTPRKQIDLITVTIGPGLIPSLLVGTNFAKALAYNWQKPIMGINHIEGHIYANWLNDSAIEFPVLCLVVSGGHSQLVLMKDHGKYQLLGETRDDAAGEAFDKVAKLLGLGYPGGPIISQRAQEGNPQAFDLPRPMINSKDFDFSFSGLKTAVLYEVKKGKRLSPKYINDMAASFQQAVIDVLVKKTIKAAKTFKVSTVILSGGVAANQELRQQMTQMIEKELPQVKFQIPDISLCTDNAAMIATAAYYKNKPTSKQNWLQIAADANLKLVD
jgi:N6-L-threonylcarbamoyladenine synthase